MIYRFSNAGLHSFNLAVLSYTRYNINIVIFQPCYDCTCISKNRSGSNKKHQNKSGSDGKLILGDIPCDVVSNVC